MFSQILTRNVRASCRFATMSTNPTDRQTILKELLDNSATFTDIKPANDDDKWATLPYADGTHFDRRDQSKKSYRPKIDPKETSIILFPGQGSQYVGMAKDLVKFPAARDIFQLANNVLKYDLLKLCLEGPQEKLNQTKYCQLAVFVTSLAALEKLKEERPAAIDNCIATAGFSLGEITALCFAGSIQFDQALRLIEIRAEAMQIATEQQNSGMATVLYGPDTELSLACKRAVEWCLDKGIDNPVCTIANYLYPHCKVIAGNDDALKFIETNVKQFKIRRFKRLPVNGAFHTELMADAIEPFTKALKKIQIDDPIICVHSNVDGKIYRNAAHIVRQLPKQIVKPVKWEQMLHILYERDQGADFPRTFECGPGQGLKAILKQVNTKAWYSSFCVL